VIRLDDGAFSYCDKRIDCDLRVAPITVTSMRGMALVYRGGGRMYAKVTGPDRVRPSNNTTLIDKQAAAFVFMKSGDYVMKITNSVGDTLTVPLTVPQPLDEPTNIDMQPIVIAPGPPSAPMRSVAGPASEAVQTATAQRALSRTGQLADRDSVPSLPPPPAMPTVAQVQADDVARRALLGAITPGPAAQRRDPPPSIPRVTGGEPGRRRSDSTAARPPTPAPAPELPDGPTVQYPFTAPEDGLDAAAPMLEDAPTRARIATAPPAVPPPTPPRGLRPPVTETSPTALPPPPVIAPVAPRLSAIRLSEPPPTRIQRGEAAVERPFTPPKVSQVPEIPEPGLVNAARYAARFARARYQRRGAIKALGVEIKQDTEALDQVLGALGREARTAKVEGRVFSAENAAITAAEERIAQLQREHVEVDARKADENSKFGDVERERTTKLSEAERQVEEAQRELLILEGQRRGLRDTRKDVERRQKAHLKSAEDQDRQAGAAQMGDQRSDLRRAGESHRREAAALEPQRQDCDRQLAAIERPIVEATARQDAAKAELDAAKRSLSDAREGHTHRLAELDAEHKRKAREIGLAEAEITRRLVTLGTLVNLNRIEDPTFAELYQRIDRLRGAITARTTEIEKLTAERDAYDRGMLVRGVSVIGGAFVALIALIAILRAIL